MKIVRRAVEEKYSGEIEIMYKPGGREAIYEVNLGNLVEYLN
jgi:hypothetical protein